MVLLVFESCHAFLPAFWSCLRLGIPALPVAIPGNRHEQQREARRIAEAYGDSLVLHDEDGTDFAQDIAEQSTQAMGSASILRLSFSELCSSPKFEGIERQDLDPEAPSYILETSGTTGIPRAACFCGQSEPAELLDRAVLWLFPLSSSSGISGAFAQHRLTAFLPLREAIRDPDRLLALIEQHKISSFSMPPVLLNALLRHLREPNGPLERRDMSSVSRINIGSAASRPADINALQDLLTPWGLGPEVIHTGYGLTETGVVAWGPFKPAQAMALPPGEILIGPLYEKVEVRLADGVLQVRKPFSFMGYLQQPCTSASGTLAFDAFRSGEEWFDTGDRARLEKLEEGKPQHLVLCGRAKDILVVNSRKLSLPAIEHSLQAQFPHLLELVSACAMPPEEGGVNERLLLVMAPTQALERQGDLGSDLMAQLTRQIQTHLLEQFGVGAASIRRLEASAFPRTSTGKIRKGDLLSSISGVEDLDHSHEARAQLSPIQACTPASNLEQHLLDWIRSNAPLHQPLDRQQKLSAFGIDSLAFAGLIGELERHHGHRCHLERCPNDPSIADLLALFEQSPNNDSKSCWNVDARNPDQVMLRHNYEQLVRAANLQSKGKPVGLGSIARLHNSKAEGHPVVLTSAWPEPVIHEIARRLPRHPVYSLRTPFYYNTAANHQYMVFCYLEWIESIVAPLHRPYILSGNCRGAHLALELAPLLEARRLKPQLTVLLQWDPRWKNTTTNSYLGAVAYQIHHEHHKGDPEEAQKLLDRLQQRTPAIKQVVLSATNYNAKAYTKDKHPCNSLIELVSLTTARPN